MWLLWAIVTWGLVIFFAVPLWFAVSFSRGSKDHSLGS